MTLTPKAEPLAEKLRDIALYGRGIELRCIETRPTEGDIQRTLLAGAARTAHEINSVDGPVALCRGEPKQQPAAAWRPTHERPLAHHLRAAVAWHAVARGPVDQCAPADDRLPAQSQSRRTDVDGTSTLQRVDLGD